MGNLYLKVLVVGDLGAEELRRFTDYLREAGHSVLTAKNAEQALRTADQELPDAIVSSTLSPPLDAVELCWAVRKTSRVPICVFVILKRRPSQNFRISAYRTGADLILDPGAKPEELEAFLRYQTRLRASLDVPDLMVSGNLQQIRLLSVIQMVSNLGFSGRLEIANTEGQRGRIYLRKGQIVHAENGSAHGKPAILAMAEWKGGYYRFFHENLIPESTIQEPTAQLILEIASILDEQSAGSVS